MERQIALVSGASGGIGRGIAIELAKAGYDLMVHSSRDFPAAESLCDEMTREYGCRAYAVEADFTRKDAPDIVFEAFDEKFDRLDLYVNNAGVTEGAPFLEMTHETFDRVANINFRSAYFCVQHAARRMVKMKIRGNIIVISSNQQQVVMPRMSVYGPVKSSLMRFAKHASMELAKYGIRVNSIAPGFTNSKNRTEQEQEHTMKFIPLRRWATVEEVGQAVLYLVSPAARFITGTCLLMDGGASNKHFDMEAFDQGPDW